MHLSHGRDGLDVPLLGQDLLVVVPRDAPAQADPAARVCYLPEGPRTIPYRDGDTQST